MSLVVIDDPGDRPEWIRETLALIAGACASGRARLIAAVTAATDDELRAGTETEWGLGQIATHLLVVERGVLTIALRLSRSEPPGRTGQPRPAAAAVSREGIASLAEKAARTLEQVQMDFPAVPDFTATAQSPYYGPLNCFGWLLTLPNHYTAHLEALAQRRRSAL